VSRGEIAIGLARPDELAALREVERAAGELFAGWKVAQDTDPEPTDLEDLEKACSEGLLWVARSESGEPVGFAWVELIEGGPHLEEIDVTPELGRRGIGRRLLEAVESWARAAGHRSITLTTFREIPWNAPYYARCGYRALEPREWTPALAERVRDEASRGLDPRDRVVMRRALD